MGSSSKVWKSKKYINESGCEKKKCLQIRVPIQWGEIKFTPLSFTTSASLKFKVSTTKTRRIQQHRSQNLCGTQCLKKLLTCHCLDVLFQYRNLRKHVDLYGRTCISQSRNDPDSLHQRGRHLISHSEVNDLVKDQQL